VGQDERGRDLYRTPDGKNHLLHDPVGTSRANDGSLRRGGRYASPGDSPIERRPVQESKASLLPVRPGDSPVDDALLEAVADRRQQVADIAAAWSDELKAIAAELEQSGIKIKEGRFSDKDFVRFLEQASPYLDDAKFETLAEQGPEWAVELRRLREASELLGVSGSDLLVHRLFPDAVPISGGEKVRGVPDTLDRTLYDPASRTTVITEDKGVGGKLTDRLVPDPANPGGKRIRAQQMSPEYLRDLLQNDKKLGEALSGKQNAELRAAVEDSIRNGRVRYILVRTDANGVVRHEEYQLDPERWDPGSIQLPG
jgi:hypothetical protein